MCALDPFCESGHIKQCHLYWCLPNDVLYGSELECSLAPTTLTACNVTLLRSPLGNCSVLKSNDVVALGSAVVLVPLEYSSQFKPDKAMHHMDT